MSDLLFGFSVVEEHGTFFEAIIIQGIEETLRSLLQRSPEKG
jgi:hypothetical protein